MLGTMFYNPKIADMFTFNDVRFKSCEVNTAFDYNEIKLMFHMHVCHREVTPY
jgi:hypothetical protein